MNLFINIWGWAHGIQNSNDKLMQCVDHFERYQGIGFLDPRNDHS